MRFYISSLILLFAIVFGSLLYSLLISTIFRWLWRIYLVFLINNRYHRYISFRLCFLLFAYIYLKKSKHIIKLSLNYLHVTFNPSDDYIASGDSNRDFNPKTKRTANDFCGRAGWLADSRKNVTIIKCIKIICLISDPQVRYEC